MALHKEKKTKRRGSLKKSLKGSGFKIKKSK